jgi:hypothetical protein
LNNQALSLAGSLNRSGRQVARAFIHMWVRLDWLVHPLLAYTLSRALIFAAGIVGDVYLPTEEGHWVADPNSSFLSLWAMWDSQWFIQIARDGYWYQPLQQSSVAFFPLYPLVVRLVGPLMGGNLVLAGFVVSNVCFLGGLLFLYQLAQLELSDSGAGSPEAAREGARRTLYYLAFFPTAFFFNAVYTESLFLFLSVATIFFARRRRWALAAIAGMLASATRNLGVVLWALVMWEWLRCHGWRVTHIHRREAWRSLWAGIKSDWIDVVVVAAIPIGLLLYIGFLQVNFAQPTAFVEVQAAWGRQNIGPLAVVEREVRALANLALTKSNLSRMMNLGVFLAVLAMTPFIWRRLGEGYAIYVLIFVLVPASSALQSMIRYVLTLFPIFILLGWWGRYPAVDRALLATFATLLGVLATIFVNWVFIA